MKHCTHLLDVHFRNREPRVVAFPDAWFQNNRLFFESTIGYASLLYYHGTMERLFVIQSFSVAQVLAISFMPQSFAACAFVVKWMREGGARLHQRTIFHVHSAGRLEMHAVSWQSSDEIDDNYYTLIDRK